MALTLSFLFIALIPSLLVYFLGGYYSDLMWLWLPFALLLAFFVGLIFVFAVIMFLLGAIYQRTLKGESKPNRWAMWMISESAFMVNLLLRVRMHATGLGKVPGPKQTFMLVSNHLSGFDHIGLTSLFVAHRFICVSKEANMSVPVAGGWLQKAGYLSIKQDDILSGTKVIEKAGQYIASGQASVCIAPEGTRNKTFPNPELLPFHPGSFAMAYQAKCPIVVFAIQNTNCVLRRFPLRRTDVYFDCVGVLEYEEYQSLTPRELADRCSGLIQKRFEQKRARFYHLPVKED